MDVQHRVVFFEANVTSHLEKHMYVSHLDVCTSIHLL